MVRGRPTLGQVAARAGVSLKTASRALNGEYGVAATTAARVREAADGLGFRLNSMARSLASGGPSKAVGLAIPSVADPFIATVVGAVEEVVAPRGMSLLTASHHDDPEQQRAIIELFAERRVGALILIPAPGDGSYLADEIAHGLVVVSLDRPTEGIEVDCVVVDNHAGSVAAVTRLAGLGHRRIAFVSLNDEVWTLRARHEGYLAGLAANGLRVDADLVEVHCADEQTTAAFVARVLDATDPPTAFYCTQPITGRWLMRALRDRGVIADLAMFDELVDTDLLALRPQVVIASGPHRMGHLAASLAVERLAAPGSPVRTVVLDPVVLDAHTGYVAASVERSLAELSGVPA